MSDFAREIIQLLSSRHYHELAAFNPPFDPLATLAVSGRELSYSSVLSWLLRDPANGQFKQRFLCRIARNTEIELDAHPDEPIKVQREYGDQEAGRIDVFVNFPKLELAVAIEVKVWAEEGPCQISRYQTFLARRFADSTKLVVFLTRFGDSPLTAHESPDVPVLNMSWREIADMIGKCTGHGEEHDFRVQFKRHIYRSVLMDSENERKIVIDLLKQGDNARTISKIIDNYPHLGNEEYVRRFKTVVSEVTSESALDLQKYRSRGRDVTELKITIPRWNTGGLPFTLMLYKYRNSAVRVLLHSDDLNRTPNTLNEFARSSGNVVGDFPQVAYWGTWHSVLQSHGGLEEPPETLIDAEIFEDSFWPKVRTKLKEQLCPLMPLINGRLGKNTVA